MDDLNVIDQFTTVFVTYIDSGFGLLGPDVAFLTTILVGIDIVLAGLLWAFSDDKSVMPALIKKVLYVGAFAFILNNFQGLANILFESFAGLGLRASGTPITAADLMRPGFVAAAGYTAATPLLSEVSELLGPIAFFENFVTIAVLLFAWVVVLLAFFILAIQLFITILEFKLTTLAGFVLVPFALWGRSAFLAERVLGNVVASGIKLMVLAVIVGIGSTLFGSFASSFAGGDVTLEQAAATVLGALALFMLGIFGPGIAAGLVSGAPQLGAGAAVGPAAGLLLGGGAAAGAAIGGARLAGRGATGATRAASNLGSGARGAYALGQATSGADGMAGMAAGVGGVGRAALGRVAAPFRGDGRGSRRAAIHATGGRLSGDAQAPTMAEAGDGPPQWAAQMRREARLREGVTLTAHTIRDGDRPAGGDSPRLREEET